MQKLRFGLWMGFGLRMGHYSVKNNSATKKSFQNNKFSFLISLILVKGFRPQQQPIQLPFSYGYLTSHKFFHLPFSFRSSYQNSSPRSSPQTSPLLSLYILPWNCIRKKQKNWSSTIKSCLKSSEGKVTNKQNQNYSFFLRASLVAQTVKNLPPMQETQIWSLGWEDPLEKKEWLPTPVFLPREFHGQRSLAGYSPWGRKVSDRLID